MIGSSPTTKPTRRKLTPTYEMHLKVIIYYRLLEAEVLTFCNEAPTKRLV